MQWYSEWHGLKLNLDKTKYKIFTRKKRRNIIKWKNHFYKSEEKEEIKEEKEAVKYLGIWIDTELKWEKHCQKIMEKINKTYYSIIGNLKMIMNIKAEIAWRIFQSCIISIFDYSAIIMPLIMEKYKKDMRKLYYKMARMTFKAERSTPRMAIIHQLDAIGFDNRMKCRGIQYFSHILRTPKTGILYNNIKDEWWSYMKYYILKRKKYKEKDEYLEKLLQKRNEEEHLEKKNTLIFKMINMVMNMKEKYSDIECIQENTKYDDIYRETSIYVDLTNIKEARQIKYKEEEFNIDNEMGKENEIWIFTDGSVKNGIGGYGYQVIESNEYKKLKDLEFEKYKIESKGKQWHELWMWLSRRCSIDFCEAFAIRDALRDIILLNEKNEKEIKKEIKKIRVITDSEVVLKWIKGEYKIRNNTMRDIIEDIKWNATKIMEEKGLEISIQKVKAHE